MIKKMLPLLKTIPLPKNRTAASLVRSGISLVVMLVSYTLYAMVVVPLIEPEVNPEQSDRGESANVYAEHSDALTRLLGHYFENDSWVFKTPKVLESDKGILLINNYENQGDGTMELRPFAMIFFPDQGIRHDADRASEAIVLEAPRAILRFEHGLDLGQAKFGRLKNGHLLGKITIRSAGKLPGPQDDLLITTRDVELGEDRIWTTEPVAFRYGDNHGTGREMVINLLPRDVTQLGDNRGPNVGGFRSIELIYDVKMNFMIRGGGLLPTDLADSTEKPNALTKHPTTVHTIETSTTKDNIKDPTPVEITSTGPFRFDVRNHVASFEEKVNVIRRIPERSPDRMWCELLKLHFSDKKKLGEHDAAPADVAQDETKNVPTLQAQRLEARGDPVVVLSPSTSSSVRCQRLDYDIPSRKIILKDSRRVEFLHKRNKVFAPMISYQPGPKGRLGQIEATGPGEMEGVPDEKSGRVFKAEWSRALSLLPLIDPEQPGAAKQLLSIIGNAHLDYHASGNLTADKIWMWMSERPGEKKPKPQDVTKSDSGLEGITSRVIPDRMLALGNVTIDSPQLSGSPDRLEIWFEEIAGGQIRSAQRNTGHYSNTAGSRRGESRDRLASRDVKSSPKSRYDVKGRLLRAKILLGGEKPMVDEVIVSGDVHFVETQTAKPDEAPLVIHADELFFTGASTPRAKATVVGSPATVEARGLTIVSESMQLDRGKNRMWTDGSGRMSMPVDRDLQGKKLARLQRMTVHWKKSMDFDGSRITFVGDVRAESEGQSLKTELLAVGLNRHVDFSKPPKNHRKISLSTIACRGGVLMKSVTRGAKGLESIDWMKTEDIDIDQISGRILASGPGWVESVRRGGSQQVGFGLPDAAKKAPDKKDSRGEDQITYMKIIFRRGIEGNIHNREMMFHDRVRTIYGPVAHWDDKIKMDRPEALGEKDVLLSCDRLTVTQIRRSEKGERAPLELTTEGNTLIEGQTFTARGHKVKFSEEKNRLILEGDSRTEARLWRQKVPGGKETQFAARRIIYWRTTGMVDVDGFKNLDFSGLPSKKPKLRRR